MDPEIRPQNVHRAGESVRFHLREVCSLSLKPYSESLWLFGNTEDKYSVAIEVMNFKPYFFLEYPEGLGDVQAWADLMNEDLKPWPSAPDIITRVDIVNKVPVIGFCNNQSRKLLRVEYQNQSSIWNLRKYFDGPIFVGDGHPFRTLERYHDDWGVESLFLHESGLKMQEWVEVSTQCAPTSRSTRTFCHIERQVHWKNVKKLDPVQVIPPILCCAIRIKARSSNSTATAPVAPDSSIPHDNILVVAIQMYWMGSSSQKWCYTFDDEDEAQLLLKFQNVVNMADVDCFEFLSDNCDPLQYIVARGGGGRMGGGQASTIKLSKFKNLDSQLIRKNNRICKFALPGRSFLDIQCALKKMMISPPLDNFTLKDAIFHTGIVRNVPNSRIKEYLFYMAKFVPKNELKRQCEEEVDWLRQVEQDNLMLLGFVEISSASFTQLTVAVANGQQVRVWKKLISKFHEEGLLVNKQQLQKPSLVIKRKTAESDYIDPPDLPNIPATTTAIKTKKKNDKQFRNFSGGITVIDKNTPKKTTRKKYQGGYVCEPKAGYYSQLNEATFTFDFGSLYPSIIRGNSVCYMRLCYDQKWLDDDDCIKEYIPLSDTECMVMIVGVKQDGVLKRARTIVPQTITEVCEERNRAKKLMKASTDPFLRASLDAKQLSCKVFQNAVYGFLGVEEHALLACPVLMAMVCRIGQYMIKKVRHMMIRDHGGYVVYGGTCISLLCGVCVCVCVCVVN